MSSEVRSDRLELPNFTLGFCRSPHQTRRRHVQCERALAASFLSSRAGGKVVMGVASGLVVLTIVELFERAKGGRGARFHGGKSSHRCR